MSRPTLPSYTWFVVVLVVGFITLVSVLALKNRPRVASMGAQISSICPLSLSPFQASFRPTRGVNLRERAPGSCAKIQRLANLPSSDFPESFVFKGSGSTGKTF